MSTDFKVTMNEYLPLRDVVFNTLRQAILRGELKPGERLMEIQLANKLGVSRTPIREAIRKLELEGLVLMIPRKGAEVAEITEKNLRDVLEVRCALEELAVQLACERIDDEGLEQLKSAALHFRDVLDSDDITKIAEADVAFHDVIFEATDNRRLIQLLNNLREQMYRYRIDDEGLEQLKSAALHFRDVLDSDDITKIAEADVAFHDVIFEATDNRRLIQLLNNLREQMYRYRIEYLKKKECYPQLIAEHKAIIDAIAAGDKEKATGITGQHINNQVNTVVGTLRQKE